MMTELSVVMPLQDVAPRKSWLEGSFFEGIQNSTDSTQKLNLEKILGTLIILFYVGQSSPQQQRLFLFIKKTKNNHSSKSDRTNTTNLALKRKIIFF